MRCLTRPASKDLDQITLAFSWLGSTELGVAILGSCDTVFSQIDAPVCLCLCSPPYPLKKARNYGNPSERSMLIGSFATLNPLSRIWFAEGRLL